MRRRFKCDPKWITVRYPTACGKPGCDMPINPGDRALYYSEERALYGLRCGHGKEAVRDFTAHRFDEDGY